MSEAPETDTLALEIFNRLGVPEDVKIHRSLHPSGHVGVPMWHKLGIRSPPATA